MAGVKKECQISDEKSDIAEGRSWSLDDWNVEGAHEYLKRLEL